MAPCLTNLIGRHRALEMMLRARTVFPSKASAYGMIEELGPEDTRENALERAQSIAVEIAAHSPMAVTHILRLGRAAVSPVSRELFGLLWDCLQR